MNKSSNIIIVIFALALIAAYSIYQPFILPMVVATLLVMATFNLTQYFAEKFGSAKLSTFVMVLLLILLILAPIAYAATIGVEYVTHIDKESIGMTVAKAKLLIADIPYLDKWLGEYLQTDKIATYLKLGSVYATKMGSVGLGFLKNLILVIIFYAVINYYSDRFFKLLKSLVPVSRSASTQVFNEISSTMEVVFYSIIVTAIFEGMLFGFFVSYFGFNGLLFGVMYGFASLVPIVGGALLWIPLSLYAWSSISSGVAITIVVYSIVIISIVADTFIKPMIIKIIKEELLKHSQGIDELIIFFSILAGMTSYGFWGAIIGPAITTFLIAISKIYIAQNRDMVEGV